MHNILFVKRTLLDAKIDKNPLKWVRNTNYFRLFKGVFLLLELVELCGKDRLACCV